MKKLLLTLFIAFSAASLTAYAAQGSGNPGAGSGNIKAVISNPFKCPAGGDSCTLIDLFNAIANNILLPIGGVLAVFFFIYSGFLFVTARGDEGQIKKARAALLYTAVGTVILLGAVVIANVLGNTVESLQV